MSSPDICTYFDRKYGKKNGGHPATYLPNCGLRHPSAELIRIYPTFHTLSIEQMAVYADQVTVDCVKDAEFQEIIMMKLNSGDVKVEDLTITAIANMAYIVSTLGDKKNPLFRLIIPIINAFKKHRQIMQRGLSGTLRDKMKAMRNKRK